MSEDLDFDSPSAGGAPRCPHGTYLVTIQKAEMFTTTRDDLPQATLFSLTFTVDEVISGGVPADDGKDKSALSPVAPGETRGWRTAVDKSTKINERHRGEVRACVQAACGFGPGGKPLSDAKDEEGNPVKWSDEVTNATGEHNPLEGRRMIISLTRAVSRQSNAYYTAMFRAVPEDAGSASTENAA